MKNFKYLIWFLSSFLMFLPVVLAKEVLYEVPWEKAQVGVFAQDTTYNSMDYNGWEVVSQKGGVYYCIEPETYMPLQNEISDTSHSSYNFDEYIKRKNISKDKLNKIQLLAYYGYKYPGHTSKKWYGITQVMIWKVLRPDIKYLYKTSRYGSTDVSLYVKEEKELNNLVKNHNLLPSFVNKANKNIEVSYQDEIILEDTNSVLKYFKVKDDDKIVSIKNNKLYIKPNSNKDLKITFYKEKVNSLVYFYDSINYQNAMKRGDVNNIDFNITIKFNDYNIKVVKQDNDTKEPLKEVLFELYDNEKNKIDEKLTNEVGEAIFENLKKGTYYLKEVATNDGYVLDNTEHKIVLEDNYRETITIYNKKKKGTFKIAKVDSKTNKFLSDAIFEVYKADTNEKCLEIATINDFLTFDMLEGSYYLIEKKAPMGYRKTNEKFYFEIAMNKEYVLSIENTIIEENPNTGDFSIFYNFILAFIFFGVIIGLLFFRKKTS